MRSGRHSTGFTLVELLVVLAMIALLVTLARPMYQAAVPGARVRAEVLDLARSLRESRHRAITSGKVVAVQFDPEQASYAIDGDVVTLSGSTELKTLTRNLQDDDEVLLRLEFHPDGSSTGASVEVLGTRVGYRVDVDWLTGRIRVAEQDHEPS